MKFKYGFEKIMLATRHSDFIFRLHTPTDLFIIILCDRSGASSMELRELKELVTKNTSCFASMGPTDTLQTWAISLGCWPHYCFLFEATNI